MSNTTSPDLLIIGSAKNILGTADSIHDFVCAKSVDDRREFIEAVANELVKRVESLGVRSNRHRDTADSLYLLQDILNLANKKLEPEESRLLSIASSRQLWEGDLDDAVMNAAEQSGHQSEAQDANASSLSAQVNFLLEHLGFDAARKVIEDTYHVER